MAATLIGFFNPVDILALLASGWIIQDDPVTNAESSEEVVGLGADGNYSANDIFNKLKEGALVYKTFAKTGDMTLPSIGEVSATGYLIKEFSVEYAVKDFPSLTPSVHKSVTGAAHGTYRTYTPTVTLPCIGKGIPRGIEDVIELGGDDTGIGMLKLSYKITGEFIEPPTTEFTGGEFCNAYEEISVGFAGVPASITLGTGWEYVTKGGGRGNKTAEGLDVTIRKRFTAHDVVTP